MCRYDFIEFIRNGGRRPQAQPDSLTQQGSIELVSEASDLSQAQQPPKPYDLAADPLQHDCQAAAQHAASEHQLKASDAQEHHELVASHKLAHLQASVCLFIHSLCAGIHNVGCCCCVLCNAKFSMLG